jgi:hypothetical protein
MSNKHPAHGGKRSGSGRKPSNYPLFTKAFRATDGERQMFFSLLTGDARKDFVLIYSLMVSSKRLTTQCPECGSLDLKGNPQQDQNFFCSRCGYFPIPFYYIPFPESEQS